MARTLRAKLIQLAWENPGVVRASVLDLLRTARTYDEYVDEKKSKKEKPMSKKDWEARGKGEAKLKGKGVDLDKLRKALPKGMSDKAFDDLVTQAKDMDEAGLAELGKLVSNGEEVSEWAKGNLPDSVQKYVEDSLKDDERDDEATLDERLGEFTLGLFDWFTDFVNENKG